MSTAESYEKVLMALCLWREARNCSEDARRGVLHVILNRAKAHFRGEDIISTILWPYQFSSFNAHDVNAVLMPNPKKTADWRAWQECCTLVDAPGEDPTDGALMYHSYSKGDTHWPEWATEAKFITSIGLFKFYHI